MEITCRYGWTRSSRLHAHAVRIYLNTCLSSSLSPALVTRPVCCKYQQEAGPALRTRSCSVSSCASCSDVCSFYRLLWLTAATVIPVRAVSNRWSTSVMAIVLGEEQRCWSSSLYRSIHFLSSSIHLCEDWLKSFSREVSLEPLSEERMAFNYHKHPVLLHILLTWKSL